MLQNQIKNFFLVFHWISLLILEKYNQNFKWYFEQERL